MRISPVEQKDELGAKLSANGVSFLLVGAEVTRVAVSLEFQAQNLGLKLAAEVFQILCVQRVGQSQVDCQSPCQQEAIQGQGRQEPQHHAQLQEHRVAPVGQQTLGPRRRVRKRFPETETLVINLREQTLTSLLLLLIRGPIFSEIQFNH